MFTIVFFLVWSICVECATQRCSLTIDMNRFRDDSELTTYHLSDKIRRMQSNVSQLGENLGGICAVRDDAFCSLIYEILQG